MAACRRHATCSSSRSTSGGVTACRPSGIPCVETPTLDALGRTGRPVRQPLGQRRTVRPFAGLPLHGHLPAPQSVDPERDPAGRPLHQRGAAGPRGRLRPGALRVHGLPRSTRGPCRPATRGCSATRGSCPGFRALIEDPWEKGSPAWGRWLAAQGVDVPANPHDLYEPMEGFPGAEEHGSTWAPARFPAELSQTTFVRQAVVEWLEQNGDAPFFVHASFIRPHPPRRNPLGYHDLYDGRRGRARSSGCADARGGGGDPSRWARSPWRRPRSARPEDERERRQVRATYYGAQREVDDGLAPLFEYLDEQRAGRVHPGGADERPRRDGRRPLAAREAGVLGRELPRPAHRGRPAAGGGRRARDGSSTR